MSTVMQMAMKARKHWARWLPERTRELKAEGTFEAETIAAAKLARAEIETLMMQGFREHETEEVALPMFILLKPERGVE